MQSLPLCSVFKIKGDYGGLNNSFVLVSTAPINTEDKLKGFNSTFIEENKELTPSSLEEIILHSSSNPEDNSIESEIIFVVHGYNSSPRETVKWFNDIHAFFNKDPLLTKKKYTFIGYRWPSEHFDFKAGKIIPDLVRSFNALPSFLHSLTIALTTLVLILISLIFFTNNSPASIQMYFPLLVITGFFLGIVMCLFLLRASLYFRDSYRANHYAVMDLVEILRQLDLGILQKHSMYENKKLRNLPKNKRVKISFLGHSMGGFVITQTIRILSDVFDRRSIGEFEEGEYEKSPTNSIGSVFLLGRLILVSPDIPAESIIQGRANVLANSLRRFEESYLFSNEGDLALRLASSTANYISFPAKTRHRGHRLGTISLRSSEFGIVNLPQLKKNYDHFWQKTTGADLLQTVRIGYGKNDTNTLWQSMEDDGLRDSRSIAEVFTYIDCTDYTDVSTYKHKDKQKVGLLSFAKKKEFLNFFDYSTLLFGYIFLHKDVHGGYFRGHYLRSFMYRLLFLGMKQYLIGITPKNKKRIYGFDILHNDTKEKNIQIALSPERFAEIARIKWDREEI